ncbi:xanthine dehydrogenase family protein molybdopterin-binding subunit [Ilumatobacter nonamiensis]|uniref:xanthine dehydrogenase family protein molybdopterin-binding subunit n=1 Tax=Ilumatobacter nonamiensis TaxID=467093 RepID=UPI000590F896|nr:xanthine dehydrogenase family protein molybdopterin-binding subunit [Ilumatobacter nonamiensis]
MTTTPARPGSILGTRVQRTEDPELLRGARQYLADLPLPNRLHAVFVRSEIAHGVLGEVHIDEARDMPGVVEVITGADLGVPPHHGFAPVHRDFKRPPIAVDRVRFVGEPIAVVLAETFAQGVDAAQAVWADIEPLDALVTPAAAFADGAPLIFDAHGSNEAIVFADDDPVEWAADDHVMRGTYQNQRMAVVPMEPDCAAAEVDPDTGRVTLWVSNQMPHLVHAQFCSALKLEAENVRVVTPQVGGGFGGKAGLHSEYSVVGACAIRTGRPVQWVPTRSEDMVVLPHSRGQVQHVELGCRSDGTFTKLRVRLLGDGGSYPTVGAHLPGGTRRMAQGTYRFDAIQCDIAVAVTNTTSMGAYRGAGRPEATAMLERAVDQAALELGIDPIEIRKRNLLGDDVFPFTTLTGNTYDSGRYAIPLDRAAEVVGYDALRAEQAERRATEDGPLLGIGVASYVEITAGGEATEFGDVEVHPDGSVTVLAGTQNHGQGHQTAFAMLVSDQTGIPVDRITLVDGDTDAVRTGGGTGGSRSLQLGGSAVRGATEAMVEHAKSIASRMLEADEADIVVDTTAGTIGVAGVPAQALSWSDVATEAEKTGDQLHGEFDFAQAGATFPFGAHIAVVEVDRDTGYVTVLRHVAVDDCGTVLNPLLVEGQQHGGVAAGIGQALWEDVGYDEDGNPITSNMADYAIPTAAELPMFEVVSTETPTPLNPLGAKGIGEAATIGSTPAIQNAVIDAVSHLGVRHIDLPCTPERVWSAIRDAEAGTPTDPWKEPPSIFTALRERFAAGADLTEDEAGAAAADGI